MKDKNYANMLVELSFKITLKDLRCILDVEKIHFRKGLKSLNTKMKNYNKTENYNDTINFQIESFGLFGL